MSWRAFLPNMLGPNLRFAHRRVDYAARLFPATTNWRHIVNNT